MNASKKTGSGSSRIKLAVILVASVTLFITTLHAMAPTTVAQYVLGQTDFLHSNANYITASTMSSPDGVAVDKSSAPHHLYVADTSNNRVLGWNSAASFSDGQPADLVVGSGDFETTGGFSSPQGVGVDGHGNLYVADTNNNRVVEYTAPFAACGSLPCELVTAQHVFGQADNFTSTYCNFGGSTPSARSLCSPTGVAADAASNIYIADKGNNRVLEFITPLMTTATTGSGDTKADLVFGQGATGTSFTTNGTGTTATTLNQPYSIALDSSNDLYVADYGNSRVLEYTESSSPPTNVTASAVFGQGGVFTTNSCNSSAAGLCSPASVALDSSNDLFVSDYSYARVTEFVAPLMNGETASVVYGQNNAFGATICNQGGAVGAGTLCNPEEIALDTNGNLFVADISNNRIVQYGTGAGENISALLELGQPDFFHNSANYLDGSKLNAPVGVAVDQSSTPHHLYVADSSNNRVLGWNNAASFSNGKTADLVIGEPDFNTSSINAGTGVSASGFYYPLSVAVDSRGNLYVSDFNNSRVLEFNSPFAACYSFPCVGGAAATVFGQGNNLTSSGCNYNSNTISPDSLCNPSGAQLDALDNLYIADTNNHRVLEFNTPMTVTGVPGSGDTTADLVFGQDNAGISFTTNQCNQPDGSTISANGLCFPEDVGIDSSGNVYVSDNNNNRVLEYNESSSPPSNVTANNVLGQNGSLTTSGCGSPSATTLCYPTGITLDSANDLFVADSYYYYYYYYYGYGHNRVLEFTDPLSSSTANDVFGQLGNFTASTCNLGGGQAHPTANTLCSPNKSAIDSDGAMFIADTGNNRVTIYNLPSGSPTATATATTSSSPTPAATNSATATATATSTATATATATQTATATATSTATATATSTATATATQTATATATATSTATATATSTATATATSTATATATSTATATPTTTATGTATVTPSPNGTASATSTTTTTGTPTPTVTATVTATPTATPTTTISVPATLPMGTSPVGNTVTKNLTVRNTGTNLLFVGSVTSNDPEFVATGSTTCPPSGLAHLASCTIAIGFTPSSLGAHSATIQVSDNTATSPQHVAASGTGTVDMTVTPTSVPIGNIKDGMKFAKSISVSNKQSSSVSLSEGFSGPNAGDFSITGGTCSSTLAAKATCSLTVTFIPTAIGSESATMTVTDAVDPLSPYTVAFSAMATIPESLSATKLTYGNVAQTASKTLNVTVTNHANSGPITLTGTSIGGVNAGDFAVTGGTCGGSLAALSTCTYTVKFTPSMEAAESGSVTVGVAEDPNGGMTIPLSGTGITPLTALPASLAFGSVASGHSSVNKTVTITNNGSVTVSLSDSITGPNAGDFVPAGGTCAGTLAGGGHCTYFLKFTPSIVGSESATLGVSASGDAASPHNVSLTGSGS